jgi:dTDP-4-amino-4,6-dideoxygalactose transaminase/nucleoside-diphosphate-sugar epimerase
MKQRIVVTGGAGYLGSVLVPALLDEGHEVTVVDRMYFGREALAPVLDHPNLQVVEADIANSAEYDGALAGQDAVIHLAALSNDPASDLDPDRTQRVNYEATLELARRAARNGVKRFLMASSCSVFGSAASPVVDEESTPNPVSLYAKTKVESERDLFLLSAPGMTVSALRMATLYGLSPRMRFDLAINLMTMNAVRKRSIYVLGGGKQWRPFLHVTDAARAFMTMLEAPHEVIDRQAFNIGKDEHNYQIGDLAEIVQRTLSDLDVAVTVVPDDADKRSYRVGFEKIKRLVGFEPQCDLQQGIIEIAQAVRGGLFGDCENERYYTVKLLKSVEGVPAIQGGLPQRRKFIPFALPSLGREEEEEVIDTLRSGWITTGPKTQRFEQALCDFTGARHAVAVNSCTAALHISLAALGIGPGDEVITSPVTFPATANVIVHVGARPVFVDIDPRTLNIDVEQIEAAITPRTKAIVPVHMAGATPDMRRLWEVARAHNLPVIEDAAHAIGTRYEGVQVGNLEGSLAACFSFYPIKNMTTIEGGALLTNDDDLAERARLYALHGISKDAWKRYSASGSQHYETLVAGFKYNMTDVQAAVGIHQLRRLPEFLRVRQRYAHMYRDALADLPEIELLGDTDGVEQAWHLFIVMLRTDRLTATRDEFIAALREENVGTGIHFRSLHLQPFYRDLLGELDLPHAADISDRLFSLPLYPKMTERDVQDVIKAMRKLVAAFRLRDDAPALTQERTLAPTA